MLAVVQIACVLIAFCMFGPLVALFTLLAVLLLEAIGS